MKNMSVFKKLSCLFLVIFQLSVLVHGQSKYTVKGVVRDLATNQTVPSVMVSSIDPGIKTLTDANGTFSIYLEAGDNKLFFSHIAYNSDQLEIKVSDPVTNVGTIMLTPKVIGLKEVHVISSFVSDKSTPVAVSTISSKTIERQTANQDYPEILKLTPGVYATKVGGGSGDDRLTIRGFQQENIALLLNGVPVSSMENGLVYWSNWSGLSDATEAIQVQRGLGASKAAMNSVGGTVNIITKSTQAEEGGSYRISLSDYGNRKSILQLSTGKMKNGIAVTFLGSRNTGNGYVDGTYVNGWAYFLSVSKELTPKHKLVFTALGSPERHGQRNYGLSYSDYLKYGNKYNPSWGIYKGKVLNLSENFYHKPQLNLNHYWNLNPKLFIASSAYLSFGYGGGRYTESFNSYSPQLYSFKKDGQVDFEAAYSDNLANSDSIQLTDGSWVKNYSKHILTNYRANHYWGGILSSVNYSLNEKLKLTAGLHLRTFKSRLYEEIDDLMGGEYWIEQYAWSKSGIAGRNQIKKVGDVINVDNYSMMKYGSLFAQLEYQSKKLSCFAASTISSTAYQRKDPYNYVIDPFSEKIKKSGFDVKTGLSYEILEQLGLFAHVGYYSREPFFKFVYVNFSNTVARDLRNEKIASAEIGLNYNSGWLTARVNGYYTNWKDKALLSYENIQLADSSLTRSLIKGMNALHKGLEIEATALVFNNLSLSATLSFGDWKWMNDVSASIFDDNHVLVDSTKIYIKGLYVGDAPQTQMGASVDYTIFDKFNLICNWVYYDRLYSNFDPSSRTNSKDRAQPYRIPGYSITDLYLSYDTEIQLFPVIFQISCQNVFDKEAITRGEDGTDHTLSTFTGFWSQGRTYNFSVKVSF